MRPTLRVASRHRPRSRAGLVVLVGRDRCGLPTKREIALRDFVTVTVAAHITGIERSTLFRLAARGVLPTRRLKSTGYRVVRLSDAVHLARVRGLDVSRLIINTRGSDAKKD